MDVESKTVIVRRRTLEEKRAYLEGLDDPENTSEQAMRWRAMTPEMQQLAKEFLLGELGGTPA